MPMASMQHNGPVLAQSDAGLFATILGGVSAWSVVLTIFLGLVLYDQGKCNAPKPTTTQPVS